MILRCRDKVAAPCAGPGSLASSGTGSSRIVLAAGPDDAQRAIRERTLQRLGLVPWSPHPDIVLLGRRQDHRHGLGVNAADLGVRLACQEGKDVGGDLALLRFPNAGPVGPQSGKAKQGTSVVRGEPDRRLFALDRVVFGKRRERDETSVVRSEPTLPMGTARFRMFVVPLSGSN